MKTTASGDVVRKLFVILTFAAIIAAVFSVVFEANRKSPAHSNGMADLTSWNFQNEVRALNGEWEFYWNRFLEYPDFHSGVPLQPDQLAHVPENWNHYEIGGTRIGESGFATYRLRVNVPETAQFLVLNIKPTSSAYRVYINDQLLATAGVADTTRGSFVPDMRPVSVQFAPPGTSFDIIFHVSNFEYIKAGMNHSILLGTPEQIQAADKRLIFRDLFVLGSLALAAFYSLSMYLMNRQERISLFLGCLCIVFMFRIIITGSYFIYVIAPKATIEAQTYINYFTAHGGVLVFALMIGIFFPNEFSERMRRYVIVLTTAVLIVITIVPAYMYSRYYLISDILCLIVLGYAYYVAAKAVVNKRPFAILSYGANAICLLLILIDFYFAATNHAYKTVEFSTIGFFAFIVVYSFILGRRSHLLHTEVSVLSRKLLELDKLKDEFLANTSHELKTPLHGIIGIAGALLQGSEGQLNSGQKKNIELIVSSGRKLSHLVHDILDMSKLKHGDIVLVKTTVQIRPLVESVLTVFKSMYPHKPLIWSVDIPHSLPPVDADENRLVQILYNLMGNAAKFTDQGEIKVTAQWLEGSIFLHVSDTGIGIAPNRLESIFLPFEQADSSATREHGGVGLGLSITKHLVELHGGRIEVVSTPGAGSRFTVQLPASEGKSAAQHMNSDSSLLAVSDSYPARQEVQIDIAEGGSQRILVVDDDYISLQSAVNLLKLDGYSVTAVTSGSAALERIGENSDYQLVILDVMMPEMSGYEVCKRIRETNTLAELPILLVTAKYQQDDLVLGFDSGANDFLTKPFEPTEFRARVRTLIEWNSSMNRAFKSEIAFLQAQIKPHFIHNTLTTISYFCTVDGAKAQELLNNFSDYLRCSFDFRHAEKLIPLEKELRIVTTYLEIEKERFGNRLQVQLDVEPDVDWAMVPPLLIQPLVENAVIHGVLKQTEGGTVRISVKREGTNLRIGVHDNGVGMDEEQLARMLAKPYGSGIGLSNIRERLRKLYGGDLTLRSEAGKGTVAAFTLPLGSKAQQRAASNRRQA